MRDFRLKTVARKSTGDGARKTEEESKDEVMRSPLAQSLKKHFTTWNPEIVKDFNKDKSIA